MNGELEIIIPVCDPSANLSRTLASLAAQIDRQFSVLFSINHSHAGLSHLSAAQEQLKAAGISTKILQPPDGLRRIEHWNWAHAHSRAEWLKPLLPGEELKPAYVEKVRRRIAANPKAKLIRCDAELQTDWGTEILSAPSYHAFINPVDVLNHFPKQVDWLAHSLNFAYGRTAWLSLGGYSPQLPGCATLNLNVLLVLHHGMENIPEALATGAPDLNENGRLRVNHAMELWFILRQTKNYCLAAKLPWREQCLLWRAFAAASGRR